MRVLVGSATTIESPTFVAADGETPAATASTPAVAVTDWDDDAIGSAPTASATDVTGVYSAVLASATHAALLNLLTVTWTGTVSGQARVLTQQVEVVGAHYATLPELRALDGLGSVSGYPTARLVAARDEFARIVEQYRGVSYVPRLAVERLVGDGSSVLLLSNPAVRSVRSVTVNGTALTLADVGIADSHIEHRTGFAVPTSAGPNVVVVYEHGYDGPNDNVRHACMEYVRSSLLRGTSTPARDVIFEGVDGTRYSTPSFADRRPTGWFEVDRRLNSEPDRRLPGIA